MRNEAPSNLRLITLKAKPDILAETETFKYIIGLSGVIIKREGEIERETNTRGSVVLSNAIRRSSNEIEFNKVDDIAMIRSITSYDQSFYSDVKRVERSRERTDLIIEYSKKNILHMQRDAA